MDFVTGLPPAKSIGRVYDIILVIGYRYYYIALYLLYRTDISAEELIELFTERVIALVGPP